MRRRIFLYVRTPLLERTVNYPNNVLRLIESGVDGGTVALDISNASFDLFYSLVPVPHRIINQKRENQGQLS